MIKIALASRNQHKAEEIQAILGEAFIIETLKSFPDAPELIEDGDTFEANATAKAVQLASWLSGAGRAGEGFVLADDSGLEVDALNGEPGVQSARFAALDSGKAGNSPDSENNAKLLRLLEKIPFGKRTARFRCVLALTPLSRPSISSASPVCHANEYELATQLFHGSCEGRIIETPRGIKGFGYDPLFIPTGFDETFAELGESTKNQISHRAKALKQLKNFFRG